MKPGICCVLSLAIIAGLMPARAKESSSEVLRRLSLHNVVYDTPSVSGSMESMPIGNGDITANVWVEKGGDLVFYIGKSDSWSEATRLLKVGRVRVSLSPNPFEEGRPFLETLDLTNGEIQIKAGSEGKETLLRIWVDANQPVIRISSCSDKPVSVKCVAELIRRKPFTLASPEDPAANSFRGLENSPVRPAESADRLIKKEDRIEWCHRNESSFYPMMTKLQNVPELEEKHKDPYLGRTFGGSISGEGLAVLNDSTLCSSKDRRGFEVAVCVLTSVCGSASEWDQQLDAVFDSAESASSKKAERKHRGWWNEFWNRSYVFISGDSDAEKVTRSYILQRYMMACQSRGAFPVKFNGGLFTFDFGGNNGDYRRWGPGYWHQNTRLLYWPLAASGDFDLKMPFFDMYLNMLPLQRDVTRKRYGHGGTFFPETLNFWGLYNQSDWGWNNSGDFPENRYIRYHFQGALEVLADMLDYYDYTQDDEFASDRLVPFASEVIRFFNEHWERKDGKIWFSPANALEEYWDCSNPVDYIAGLRYDIAKLKELPDGLADTDLLKEWDCCLKDLPEIPLKEGRILPAEEYGPRRNVENPECYPVFPYRLYGIGHPDTDISVAVGTFNQRIYKNYSCWSQDPVQAAMLGLTDEAKRVLVEDVDDLEPGVRFPAFWKAGSDYIPDLDHGGTMSLGLQNMLLQCVGDKIFVLPAFPKSWNVDFKLKAYKNTTVRVKAIGGEVVELSVSPKSREPDISIASEYQ